MSNIKYIFAIFFILLFLYSCSLIEIKFSDKNIENAVRSRINNKSDKITLNDLKDIDEVVLKFIFIYTPFNIPLNFQLYGLA